MTASTRRRSAVRNQLSVGQIAAATGALAEKARASSLTGDDISGGSFTVSNLPGMFGVNNFTAIINPPMGAILALGKGQQKVVVSGSARGGHRDQRHPVL